MTTTTRHATTAAKIAADRAAEVDTYRAEIAGLLKATARRSPEQAALQAAKRAAKADAAIPAYIPSYLISRIDGALENGTLPADEPCTAIRALSTVGSVRNIPGLTAQGVANWINANRI